MSNKHPSNVSIEDLLKALNNENTDDTFLVTDPYFLFIQTFNIKEGEERIKSTLLKELFDVWKKTDVGTKRRFELEMGKYITPYSTNKTKTFFKLDKSILDIIKHLDSYKRTKVMDEKYSTSINAKSTQKNYQLFVDKCEIKSGKLYVEADIFYHVYDTWCYKNKKSPLSYTRFVGISKLFFEHKWFGKAEGVWFALDHNIKQHISPEAVANWREGRKRRGKEKNYKVEKKANIIYPETKKE